MTLMLSYLTTPNDPASAKLTTIFAVDIGLAVAMIAAALVLGF